MRYSFGNLKIGSHSRELIQKCLDKNWVSGGEQVKRFEELFRKTFGYQEAISTSSGTTACFTALASLHDWGATWGDEVIVPALSFVATSNAVLAAGFKPVFVDIRRETLNIDPSLIERALTPKTRAIQVVHTMGKPVDMDIILEIAEKYKLVILEDSCEAHGATYKGKPVGGIGLAGTFSFYAAHIICSGEGGMISTNNDEFAKLLRSVRSHGRPDGTDYFQFDRFGFNCKMNDLEASVGIEGIENFKKIFDQRKENLNYLLKANQDLKSVFHLLEEEDHEVISAHAFSLVIREGVPLNGKHLSHYLQENGTQVKTLFGSLPTQHRVFKFLGYSLGDFPEAEFVGNQGLHFGSHQYLTRSDLDFVTELLHSYIKNYL